MTELEKKVRGRVKRSTTFDCVSKREVGISGSVWQIDGVVVGDGGRRVGYLEVKDTWNDANKSTYINHMRRAYARMGDFRHKTIPKAIIVGRNRQFGHKDWDALFESIDCSLLAFDNLNQFIDRLK